MAGEILTRKALESGVKIFDGGSVDIADVGHQVGDLCIVNNRFLSQGG